MAGETVSGSGEQHSGAQVDGKVGVGQGGSSWSEGKNRIGNSVRLGRRGHYPSHHQVLLSCSFIIM